MKSLDLLRADAREIFLAGVQGADPAAAVRSALQREGSLLRVQGHIYDLAICRNLYLAGSGKAGVPMAQAALEVLGERVSGGVIIVPYGHKQPLDGLEVLEASHPIPDEAGVAGTQRVMEIARHCDRGDLLVFLLSGGSSALLACPASGISLQGKQRATSTLLASGATIHQLNAVRKHLSRIKGGRLAELSAPARLLTLVLSDVSDDALEVIGSGPTAPDPTSFADCLQIIARYGLEPRMPRAVLHVLSRGLRQEIPETLKPGNRIFAAVQNIIVANNRTALEAARKRAEALGYRVSVLAETVQGESRAAARAYVDALKKTVADGIQRPACFLSGGETTVTVAGDGVGGRNQEFVVAASLEIQNLGDVVILSAGTDGMDGPTNAAGGIVDNRTVSRGIASGLDARIFLERNDSYSFLRATNDLFITGPTLTNVMDLQITLLG